MNTRYDLWLHAPLLQDEAICEAWEKLEDKIYKEIFEDFKYICLCNAENADQNEKDCENEAWQGTYNTLVNIEKRQYYDIAVHEAISAIKTRIVFNYGSYAYQCANRLVVDILSNHLIEEIKAPKELKEAILKEFWTDNLPDWLEEKLNVWDNLNPFDETYYKEYDY